MEYTLVAARAALPQVRQQLAALRRVLGPVRAVPRDAASNGGGNTAYNVARLALDDVLMWFADRDIEIKDPDRGIIDFPHRTGTPPRDRIVYLCYLDGEDDIEAWHEVADGFAGRRSLKDLA